MCTLNNHELWSRNIHGHQLMVLNMVPTYQHESNQNIFRFRYTKRKTSLFCFAKWQTSQTGDLLSLTKENLFLITSMHLFETCPNQKMSKGFETTSSKL